jgi:integrating conjugative element protein (TIGR03759 family)
MRFINIYYEVFDKEVGSKPMVDMSGFKSTSNKIDLSNESLAVFFSINCTQCKSFATNLQSLVKTSKIKSIDIYFKDHESDTEISDWAKEVGVDIGLVNSKLISLNSGSQLSEQLGITGDSKIFVRKGERLEELSFSDLLGMY